MVCRPFPRLSSAAQICTDLTRVMEAGGSVRGPDPASHRLTTFCWQAVICCVSDFVLAHFLGALQCEYLSERLRGLDGVNMLRF